VRKTTRRGGGLNCAFQKLRFSLVQELFSGSESEEIQSLIEFRVLCSGYEMIEQRNKEHKQLYRFLPQTGSSPVPLALPRRVPLKCNVRLQVAQSHKKETSLLKDNSKRLPCSRTTPRDFLCSITTERDFLLLKHN